MNGGQGCNWCTWKQCRGQGFNWYSCRPTIDTTLVSKSRNKKMNIQRSNEHRQCAIKWQWLSPPIWCSQTRRWVQPFWITIQKDMRALLAEIIDLLITDYDLNVIDSRNNTLSFVWVPKTSSDRSVQNPKNGLSVRFMGWGIFVSEDNRSNRNRHFNLPDVCRCCS